MTDERALRRVLQLIEAKLRDCVSAGFFTVTVEGARVRKDTVQITVSGGPSSAVRLHVGAAEGPTPPATDHDGGDSRDGSA